MMNLCSTSIWQSVQLLSQPDMLFREDLTKLNIADYCGISADYLSQILKKEMDENLSTYILRQKLEKAKILLLKGVNEKDICTEAGFSSQTYFITVFKSFYKK